MIMRIGLFGIAGMMLAAALHIIMVLILPMLEADTLYNRVSDMAQPNTFTLLEGFESRDPLLVEALCVFELAEQPFSIDGDVPENYWAVALFDQRASLVFTMSDTSSPNGEPDLLVLPTGASEPEESDNNVLVVPATPGRYFAMFRTFAPDDASRARARAVLTTANCSEVELPPEYVPSFGPGETPVPRSRPEPPAS